MLRNQTTSARLILALICGVVAFSLTACFGINFGAAPASTPTPVPQTAVPTQPPLTTFSGEHFSIKYPQTWKVNKDATSVTFSEPNGIAYFRVNFTPNPGGFVSPSQQVQVGLRAFQSQAKDYKPQSIASSTTVANTTWSQGSATGSVTVQGNTAVARVVVLGTNHPQNDANTMAYTIAYTTADQLFPIANTTYFQPMLQSFAFNQA